MDSWLFSIELMTEVIKKEKLWERDPYSLVNPSAYDTAWLAMIPDPDRPGQPMFQNCLDWVLRSQMEDGFWGESDSHGLPTIESLPATLACLVVLTKWNVGKDKIEKALAFLGLNTKKLLDGTYGSCPRWFAIIFPGMIELAQKTGLYLAFHDHLKVWLIDVFNRRQRILETEELIGDQCPPLLSFLEALPSSYEITDQVTITIRNEITSSGDGSLYQSPSATAQAFLLTGNSKCSHFLQALVQRCPNGVPPTYPLDEELIRLCLVNQIQRLGLAQHFTHEIETILSQAYRSMSTWGGEQFEGKSTSLLQFGIQLHKDALAFRLLRMQGYHVSPCKLLMLIPRLLNDIQSYRKEKEQGKLNYVLLYLKENPKANIEDSIAHVRNILEMKRQELLQHVLLDEFSNLPKLCKLFHLACVKVFQMFFNTSNRYDSNTDMLEDIRKALYMPLNVGFFSLDSIGRDRSLGARKEFQQVRSALVRPFNSQTKIVNAANQAFLAMRPRGYSCRNVLTPSSFRFSFN
nr:terpene synthase 34 [Aquilaria agallochum]